MRLKNSRKSLFKFIIFTSGLAGGIANGRWRPADEHQQQLAIKYRHNPQHVEDFPYKRRQMQFQCLPLTSIVKALGKK